MKRILLIVLCFALFQASVFAVSKVTDVERHVGGTEGWVDSFEDQSVWVVGETIPRSALTNTSNVGYENRFLIAEDPEGQGGQCLMFEYGMFSQAGTTQNRRNPSFELVVPTQQMTIAYTGDCQMSFDMYLPENFYCSGSDTTSIDMIIFPKCTGSVSSSDYQKASITKDGLYIQDFPLTPLPIGKWFNIKYILHCDVTNGIKGDLYVDGREIAKNNPTRFTFAAGNGTNNIVNNGIASIRFTLTTTNSSQKIEPSYKVYMDNFEIRAMKNIDMLTYSYSSGLDYSDVLQEGFNTFDIMLRNRTDYDTVPVVGMVLYKDGCMESVYLADHKTLAAHSDEKYSISTILGGLDDGDYEMRTFVWDGAETLNSVIEQIVIKE